MTDNTRMRGDLPFPDAGEGIVLRFTNSNCVTLQEEFGDGWFLDVINKCDRSDMKTIARCVALAAKKDGKPAKLDFDKIDAPLVDIAKAILDALFLAMHGRTFEGYQEHIKSLALLPQDDDPGNA